jgi:phage gp29-like protein
MEETLAKGRRYLQTVDDSHESVRNRIESCDDRFNHIRIFTELGKRTARLLVLDMWRIWPMWAAPGNAPRDNECKKRALQYCKEYDSLVLDLILYNTPLAKMLSCLVSEYYGYERDSALL